MKKCIFIIVAMFVATYANAQIVVNSRFKSMTFDERCELLRQTRLTEEMTYEERFEMLKLRYGV